MTQPGSDRNLLFGILAVQMDFVRSEALLTAMNAWILDKARPLGQILVAQGALRPDLHDLLEAVVQKHLEVHGDDPRRSLAAFSSDTPCHRALQGFGDADVQASLALATADQSGADGDITRDHDASAVPTRPGMLPPLVRFRMLRPHARGGLGEVFVARDLELNRDVALKEIQRRHADKPESRARFLLEAEVTGGLEHPGVVPVYGLGSYADGRPFYAMRFIQGDSLKDAIAAFHNPRAEGRPAEGFDSLAFRQLLGRFVSVCQAIAYAHSRGVLHRDLKPANVMLGPYGETLVVDWGLAKVQGRPDAEVTEEAPDGPTEAGLTQAGKAIGTPAYMSPEQAAGQLELLGPGSDVYSLGATLYCLLTGRAPIAEGSVGAMLGRVQRGEFPPPRQVNGRVPMALEALCLKAMALRPEDRYASPRELAEEVERWLADEPVRVHRDPARARLGRWLRKHPALAAGVGALLLTGVLALAVSTLLIGGAQRETARALLKEEQARKDRALARVNALRDAAPGAVPGILADLQRDRTDVLPRLRALWAEGGDEARRMRLALALLPIDPETVRTPLLAWMLKADDPAEVLLVREALLPHGAELRAGLWTLAEDVRAPDGGRLRGLVALAAFDPRGERWGVMAPTAARLLLAVNPFYQGQWAGALRPVRQALQGPLAEVCRGEQLAEHRQTAALVLADYAADQPDLLADLLLDVEPKQAAVLMPALAAHRTRAAARLRRALSEATDWKDAPLDPAWEEPAAALRDEVEQAGGLLAERFALCHSLPLERLVAVTEGLRPSGFRPVRVRPWAGDDAVRVAVVWARDRRAWKLDTGLTAAETRQRGVERQKAGFIPVDVAGYVVAASAGRKLVHAVVWVKSEKGEQRTFFVALNPVESSKVVVEWSRNFKFSPLTLQAAPGPDGTLRFSGVGGKSAQIAKAWRWNMDKTEAEYEQLLAEYERWLPADVQVHAAAAPRRYGSVRHARAGLEAAESHGLGLEAHLARCRELAAQDYRPAALSVASIDNGVVTASLWHRPRAPPPRRELLAKRQALAGVALLHLGDDEPVWPLLKHTPEPEVRSQLVWRAGLHGVDPLKLVRRLEAETDTSARRALLVALGEYPGEQLPPAVRRPLTEKLLRWYRDDPDPGIHGAIDWLLRHGKEGPRPRPLDWGQAKALKEIDEGLKRRDPDGVRGWYVNPEGQTLVLVKGPVTFRMGSPADEAGRLDLERPHRQRIGRSYAIASKPVTVAQFQRFLKNHPKVPRPETKVYAPEADCPVLTVSWFMAAQYCNWLSARAGIPEAQWCYPPHAAIKDGMKPYPDHLKRQGYRLATEAEWEYACRAGAESSRSYGSSRELLPRYAWYIHSSPDRSWPVGQKRPNDLGLFDMHGNAFTWVRDGYLPYPTGAETIEDKEDSSSIESRAQRVLRGGSFSNQPLAVRSAFRGFSQAGARNGLIGMRVARTCE